MRYICAIQPWCTWMLRKLFLPRKLFNSTNQPGNQHFQSVLYQSITKNNKTIFFLLDLIILLVEIFLRYMHYHSFSNFSVGIHRGRFLQDQSGFPCKGGKRDFPLYECASVHASCRALFIIVISLMNWVAVCYDRIPYDRLC